jgi:hypothetical protein
MATKRKAAASSPGNGDSARMVLARATAALAKAAETFQASVDEFNKISSDKIIELDREIEVKAMEYEDRTTQLDQCHKRKLVELDLDLQKRRRTAAVDFLKECGEEPVPVGAVDSLKQELQLERSTLEQKLTEQESRLKRENHAALGAVQKTKDLEHKAKVAEIEATNRQNANEILALKQTIKEQREEISAQRALTQSVAEASKQGAISQNFGK